MTANREEPTTSDTKIAASFRVSLTALVPKSDHRSRAAWARLHVHAARINDAATGSAAPVFDPSV